MTDAERKELQAAVVARCRAQTRARRRALPPKEVVVNGGGRKGGGSVLAARWAHLHGKTLSAAAREFGVNVASVAESWARHFPGESALVSRRMCVEDRQHPEDEVTL